MREGKYIEDSGKETRARAKARLEKATNYMGGGVHDALRVLVIIIGTLDQNDAQSVVDLSIAVAARANRLLRPHRRIHLKKTKPNINTNASKVPST